MCIMVVCCGVLRVVCCVFLCCVPRVVLGVGDCVLCMCSLLYILCWALRVLCCVLCAFVLRVVCASCAVFCVL